MAAPSDSVAAADSCHGVHCSSSARGAGPVPIAPVPLSGKAVEDKGLSCAAVLGLMGMSMVVGGWGIAFVELHSSGVLS